MSADNDVKDYVDGWQDGEVNAPKQPSESKAGQEYKALKEKSDTEFTAGWNADGEPKATEGGITTSPVRDAGAISVKVLPAIEPAKAMSFKETFAAQRKAGAKTFDWNGKKYTTELAAPTTKPKAAPIAAPANVAAPTPAPVAAPAPAVQKTTLAPPAQMASTARTYAPSGRNYAHVIPAKVVDSPARTSAPSGRNYAYVPDAAPKAVASPVRTSAPGSGRNYTPAPNVARNAEDAE